MVQSRFPAPMAEIHLVLPILPGRTEAWRRFVQELQGPQQAEWKAWRKRVGLIHLWAQLQAPPKQTFVLLRIKCGAEADWSEPLILDKVPFDRWLREQIRALHGIDLADLESAGQQDCRLDIEV